MAVKKELKELKQEEKKLEEELKSNYRIYNFLTYEQKERLIKIAERLEYVQERIEMLK